MSGCAAPHLLDRVPRRLEQDDVDLVEEDAGQQPEAGGKDGDNLHGRHKLAVGADVGRDEGDPDDEEDEHAESDELGLVEVLGEFAGLEGEEKTDSCQEAGVAYQEAKSHQGALVTGDENDLILQLTVPVARWGCIVKPNHAGHDLHKRAKKNQEELEIQTPPFPVKAGGYFRLEDQQDSVGLHQDAGDAEHKADPEGRLAEPAGPVFGLADEDQGAGEAADE